MVNGIQMCCCEEIMVVCSVNYLQLGVDMVVMLMSSWCLCMNSF